MVYLLPIKSLLTMLGVELHPSGKLILAQGTPAIFPVKLNFKGAEIIIEEGKTILIQPGKPPRSLSRRESAIIQL